VDRRTMPRCWARVGVALSAVLAAGTFLAPSARATPTDDARQRVQQAAQQLTTLDEQVHQGEGNVAAQQHAAGLAAEQAATAQAAVDAYAPQLRAIAQSGYTGEARSRMAAFLTSGSADDLVQQLTTLDVIAAHTNEIIFGAARAEAAAQQAKATADAAAAKATAALNQLKQQQTQAKALVTQYQAELSQLSGADRAAVTTALAGQTLGVPTPAQIAAIAPSPAVAKVINTALAQVGAPYVWAGASPGGFDCSGLTLYAFASVGVNLPHSAEAQYGLGQHVDRAHLQPGDLVFFYSPISHVGLYIGNGMMVHARTFGMPVAVVPVDQSGYVGATHIPVP
jgi:cell wall-associated NlpC family hydrolase